MKDKQIEVTVLWYKSSIVRLSLDGKKIWETDESTLVNVLCDDISDTSDNTNQLFKTTVTLSTIEAIEYSAILLRGIQVGRLKTLLILLKSKMIEFNDKIKRFEINQIIIKAMQDFDDNDIQCDNCDKRCCANCSDAELDDVQGNIDNNSSDSDKENNNDIQLNDDIIQR